MEEEEDEEEVKADKEGDGESRWGKGSSFDADDS